LTVSDVRGDELDLARHGCHRFTRNAAGDLLLELADLLDELGCPLVRDSGLLRAGVEGNAEELLAARGRVTLLPSDDVLAELGVHLQHAVELLLGLLLT